MRCQLQIRWEKRNLVAISQRLQSHLAEFLKICQGEETTKNPVGLHNEHSDRGVLRHENVLWSGIQADTKNKFSAFNCSKNDKPVLLSTHVRINKSQCDKHMECSRSGVSKR